MYYAQPGSKSWKRLRLLKNVLFVATSSISCGLPIAFIFLDKSAPDSETVELAGVAVELIFLGLAAPFINVDVLLLRLKSTLAIIDAAALVVVIVLLALYGQGFVVFGSVYFCCLYYAAYTFDGIYVDTRLNVRKAVKTTSRIGKVMTLSMIVSVVAFRISILFKQVSVSTNEIALDTLPNGAGPITIRDVWEFFVDLVVLRVIFMGWNLLIQPLEKIYLGSSFGKIMDISA